MGIRALFKTTLIRLSSFLNSGNQSKAIFYHDIHSKQRYTDMSTSVNLFEKHINILRESGYEIVPKINKPIGQIEISFDDGFLGVYENIDLLQNLNIPVQLFIVSSYLNKPNYINKEQLLELNLFSNIKIASHTHSHRILNKVAKDKIIDELRISKDILEGILCNQIDAICFPEGKFSNQVIQISKEVGYTNLYSSIPGFYFDEFLPGVKKRSLVQFAQPKEFKAILQGGDHFLAKWYRKKHYN